MQTFPQPGQPVQPQRSEVYGWRAEQYGKEKGKAIEYTVTEFPTKRGGLMKSVEFYRPYLGIDKNTGMQVWKKSFGVNCNESSIRELVDRINHLIQAFFPSMGQFVLMSGAQQAVHPLAAQPMQAAPQMNQAFQQPMPPLPAMPPVPQYGAVQQAVQQVAQPVQAQLPVNQTAMAANPFLNGDIPF